MRRPVLVLTILLGAGALLLQSQVQLQVGYALITGTAPVSSALFSSRNTSGVLVWEAGVAAVEPLGRGRVFVEQSAGRRTGIALVNAAASSVTATLTLRDAQGVQADQKQRTFAPGEHLARFVNEAELFPDIAADFEGSLTFEVEGGRLAAVTLRESVNEFAEAIFATLPVVDLDAAASTADVVFPHIGAGQGLSTRIILINAAPERIGGEIRLFDDLGAPLTVDLDGQSGSTFSYQIEAEGTFRGELRAPSGLAVGFAVVTTGEGSRRPEGVAIFRFEGTSAPVSEAGVGDAPLTRKARVFVDQAATRTGVALANPGPGQTVTLRLLDRSGQPLATTGEELAAGGHLARFADELFEDEVFEGFTGLLEVEAPGPVAAVTLKLTTNSRADPILTTLPVADLENPPAFAQLVMPHLGFGEFGAGEFRTRLILINRDTAGPATGTIDFFQSNGMAMQVPFLGDIAEQAPYTLAAGAGAQLRPGNTATASQIILDGAQPAADELVVNEGSQFKLRVLVVDTAGEVRDDLAVGYESLSPDVASVDAGGTVTGVAAGFTTLTVTSGSAIATGTISVVTVSSGSSGFQVTGVAQDSAQRLYLANTIEHTILLAEDLGSMPEIYAGQDEMSGLVDDERLKSLFNNPSHLAIDQAEGALYVSDGANHAIRQVDPGDPGAVQTLTGGGEAGSEDGTLAEAAFNNPQGIALDEQGSLWVADSGNHTIRRIDLAAGTVQTVAGQPGSPGLADGSGPEARFNSPGGLSIEKEPLARQLERELQGLPPPPASVLVADTGNGAIRRVTEEGTVETIGGGSGAGGAMFQTAALTFSKPAAVAADPFGNIYVSEPERGRVVSILPDGRVIPVAQAESFSSPRGLLVTRAGRVVVTDLERTAREIRFGAPLIQSVTPQEVGNAGGEQVTIRGRNFSRDAVITLAGEVIDTAARLDTGAIIFATPPLPSGRATLTVQSRGGLAQTQLFVSAGSLNDLPQARITTVAGGSTFAGDGLKSFRGTVTRPRGIAVDQGGNLFIADTDNNRIRVIDADTGIINTLAGAGPPTGRAEDGIPAPAATLALPYDVALGPAGNILIADTGNHRIRRVNRRTGIITTVAGMFADRGFSGDGGSATAARLDNPRGIATDRFGNLYIADTNNHRIRRVDAETGVISTIAGNGSGGFSGDGGPATSAALNRPRGVTVDPLGRVYIGDTGNHRVRKVDLLGRITTLAGNGEAGFSGDGGPATEASLASPTRLFAGAGGTVLVVDTSNDRVRVIDGKTGVIGTLSGGGCCAFRDQGPLSELFLSSPRGIALDASGNFAISDSDNNRVLRIDLKNGVYERLVGQSLEETAGTPSVTVGDNEPAIASFLVQPADVTIAPSGNLVIADLGNLRVREVGSDGRIFTVAGNGLLFKIVDDAELTDGDGGPAVEATAGNPNGLAFDSAGNLLFVDSRLESVRRIDAQSGVISTVASGDFAFPTAIAVDGADNVYVADTNNGVVRLIDAATGSVTTFAGGGSPSDGLGDGLAAASASLLGPEGIAFDSQGNLYVADRFHNRVRRVEAGTGIITTVAGNGQVIAGGSVGGGDGGAATLAAVPFPIGVALDSRGNLFISTTFNRIRRVDAETGIITTVAGTGEIGNSGDGGPAIEATLSLPSGMAVDGNGNLFVADRFNNRVRVIRGPIN